MITNINYCEEFHDKPVIANYTHPEASRIIHLCEQHYNEVVNFCNRKADKLHRDFARSNESYKTKEFS